MEAKLIHMLQHNILLLGEFQRRLAQINKLKNLDDSHAQEQIVQLSQDSIRLLHTLEPCLTYALTKFPEFKDFILSCNDAIARIKKDNAIEGYNCDCKGCQQYDLT
jgi:hypothetical protein